MTIVDLLMVSIDERDYKRRDVAAIYALAIAVEPPNSSRWATVNMAIINRWSRYGLEWIKREAWKQIEEPER